MVWRKASIRWRFSLNPEEFIGYILIFSQIIHQQNHLQLLIINYKRAAAAQEYMN